MDIKITKNNVDECIEDTALAIARAMARIGAEARDYASDLTPVGPTGHLRQSMTYVTKEVAGETLIADTKGNVTPSTATTGEEKCVYIGTNVYYAPYVEYGHRHPGWEYTGRHMIKSALENHLDEYGEILKEELRDVELKYGKS